MTDEKKSRFKAVDKATFDAFIATYPNPLVRDVASMGEPPILSFNDLLLAPAWPESVVAKVILFEDSYSNKDGTKKPNEYRILQQD